ncbi:RxLR-like protein [Phytophthora cinnamomi]|uniref:RxLR-like protein n=1 Tax=Phytophthora cinnamomi TaxID=4785 RepID=UPI0035596618|nr:RxLR-like protein [Phytophthora cinnamomi]
MAVRRPLQSLEADAAMMQAEEQEVQQKLEIMDELRGAAEDEDCDATGAKRRLFRFKPAFDVVLVREVIRCFPWAAGYGRTRSAWMSVATRVQSTLESMKGVAFTRGSALDHAIVKRRVDMLLEAFRKNEMAGLRGSGTPEEFDMRNKLLAILARVVDEQTLNKGAMREKRVQSALQVALRSLAELEGTTAMALPPSVGLTPPPAAATPPPPSAPLMPIAPAPVAVAAVPARASPSPSPVPQNVQPNVQQSVQQNGGNKRPLRAPAVAVSAPVQDAKRARVERATDATLSIEERKLRLEERRVALEEERLAWEKQKAQQDGKERQALLDVLSAQGSLVTELLAHLRSSKMAMNTHGV